MGKDWPARGLYVIADHGLADRERLLDISEQLLATGIAALQYRDKRTVAPDHQRTARELLSLCRQFNCPLIINDDLDLAAEIGANGVHLGRTDPSLRQARQRLGDKAIIGVSCYNEADRARCAARQGADYIALGAFHPSTSKPGAAVAGLPLLSELADELTLPIAVIGGIRPENAPPLLAAGASLLAVISGIWRAPDPLCAAQAYNSLFADQESTAHV